MEKISNFLSGSLLGNRWNRIKLALVLFIAGFISEHLVAAVFNNVAHIAEALSIPLFILAFLVAGVPVLRMTIRELKNKDWMNEYFLMSIASVGAMGIGQFAEAAAIMIFYEIGEHAQSVAIGKSRKSISDLLDLSEDTSLVKRDGQFVEVDSYEVEVGETILIRAGSRIPLDATIIEGRGEIDTSALTGEALPVAVEEGERIMSGSLNLNTPLVARVEADSDNSTLQRIIDLSDEASLRKGNTERMISRFARYYTPLVVILAVMLAVLPPLITGQPFLKWFVRSLNLLVISCPCALVLSVPLSYFSGLGLASTRGILVKGSDVLEQAAHIETVIFDKTGTLTTGKLELTEIEQLSEDYTDTEILQLIEALERGSSHVIAESIRKKVAEYRNGKNPAGKQSGDLDIVANPEELSESAESATKFDVQDLEELPGRGVQGNVNNRTYYLGNERLMKELGLTLPATADDYSVVFLAESEGAQTDPRKDHEIPADTAVESDRPHASHKLVAALLFDDEIKSTAPQVIQDLRREGVKKFSLYSGDRKSVVEKQAKALGIENFEGELLPQDKLKRLETDITQATEKGRVAFVGDGINDAPALSVADVGIAMGQLGSDAAVESSDIVLMRDELEAIPEALRISRKSNAIAKQNIFLALGIKILVVILSFFGIGGMWAAIFADVGVTLICIANSFRITSGTRLSWRAATENGL